MPAYGKNLTPAEVTALVAFMQTLRPAQEPRHARLSCRRRRAVEEPRRCRAGVSKRGHTAPLRVLDA